MKQNNLYLMENIQVALKRQKLLDKTQFQQMMEMPFASEICVFLAPLGYSLPKNNITPKDVDQLYRDELMKMRNFLASLNFPTSLIDIFFVHVDSSTFLDARLDATNFDQQLLETYKNAIEANLHPLITQMCRTKMDFYFLQCCLRKKPIPDEAKKIYNGFLSLDFFTQIYGQDASFIKQSLASGYYGRILPKKAQQTPIEVVFDGIIYSYYRPYRQKVRGIEPIFSYIYDKKIELFDLRCLLKGKLYNLPEDTWQKAMRSLYV